MHDSRIIANRFLELAERNGDTLTPMQVLKLVYIAHGWMLGLHGRALIRDRVEAWQYGPVIPVLYNAMRRFGGSAVAGRLAASPETLTAEEEDIVEQVYAEYGRFTGPQLSRLTHAIDTPWDLTYRPGEFGVQISDDLVEDHYRQLAQA
ncbi:Panacea domain-containing protein [Phenylobacterium sp. 58.2.17]|uniref:Panacea domain-containing protein n=1 Tax=Phenylobacterium sp. 58.2.17 TaxID=2969306 RepID=UPI0022641DAE|nr:type II toxin-antitoxin system antitoxin SocA domain-containing protein [Phenylobacterium sp. 58.2.17]MCX7585008.1 DUF4065 domain-containing protein [Phenylobacterium sp. 58.2.17]